MLPDFKAGICSSMDIKHLSSATRRANKAYTLKTQEHTL